MNEYVAGSAAIVDTIFLQDATSNAGAGLVGLAYNSAGLTCYYKRSNGTAAVAVPLVAIATLGTFASGGFKAVDGVNMPGNYEFHPPNAAFAAGAKVVTFFFQGATNLAPRPIKFRIHAINVDDANAGLTALTGLTAPPAGPLLTFGTGAGQLNPAGGKVPATIAAGDYATNIPQTGDNFPRIGPNGEGLTAIGDTRLGFLDVSVASRAATADSRLAFLDAPVSSRSTYAGGSVVLAAAGLDLVIVEAAAGGVAAVNARQALALVMDAAGAGILTGAAGLAVTVRNPGNTADRIVATVDTTGNRTAVVLSPPA